jgi:hypothetical protein
MSLHRTVEKNCVICHRVFDARISDVKRGRGTCCSNACKYKQRAERQRRPIEKRFWERVDKNGPSPTHVPSIGNCWLWTGAKRPAPFDYGIIGKGRGWRATHRISWEIHNGAIPVGMCVLHRCDTPACVRPDHLFLGTDADNAADRKIKGRNGDRRGEANGKSTKLTSEQVRAIRQRFATGLISQGRLAKEYGVNQTAISFIVLRRTWTNIE